MDIIKGTGRPDIDVHDKLVEVIDRRFYAVLRVKTKENKVLVLQNRDCGELINTEIDWDVYIDRYAKILTEEGSEKLLKRLSSSALIAEGENGNTSFSIEVPYFKNGRTNWVTVSVILDKYGDEWSADIFVWPGNEEHLLHSIINLYVYDMCDYFACVDIRSGKFKMFSNNMLEKKRISELGDNYETAVEEYTKRYVVPEDREMTVSKMRLENVLEQLEKNRVYSFSIGVEDPKRGYTRKQILYRYYDRYGGKILLSRTDVTDFFFEERSHKKELDKARRLAETDSLTGILNYGGMSRQATELLQRGAELSAMLIIDLDDFKMVNDTLGHLEGDRLLKKVAETLEALSGPDSLQGRVGGDEFVVFLYNINNRKRAEDCARRICEAVSLLALPAGGPESVSCSIGVAFSPNEGEDYHTLFRSADQRVYKVKRIGKNRFLTSDGQ